MINQDGKALRELLSPPLEIQRLQSWTDHGYFYPNFMFFNIVKAFCCIYHDIEESVNVSSIRMEHHLFSPREKRKF